MRDITRIIGITGLKLSASGLAMVTTLLAAFIFLPAEFGILSFIWSLATIFAVFLDFGSSLQIRKLIPRLVRRRSLWRRFAFALSMGVVLRGALLIGAAVVYMVWPGQRQFGPEIWFAVFIALGFCLELLSVEIFRGRRFYLVAEYCNGGLRYTIYLICLGLAAATGLSAQTMLVLFTALLGGITLALFLICAQPKLQTTLATRRTTATRHSWRSAHERQRFFLVTLLIIVSQQLPVVAAAILSGPEVAAFVKVAVLFGVIMLVMLSANSMYFAPLLASTPPSDRHRMQGLVTRSARIGLVFIPIGVGLALLAPWLTALALDPSYGAAVPGAQVLILAYTLTSSMGAYAQMVLLSGREQIAILGTTLGLAGQILIMLAFWDDLGVTVYVVALAASNLVSTGVQITAGWYHTRISPGPFAKAS